MKLTLLKIEPMQGSWSMQCSTTELWQLDNYQPSQSSKCTAQVVRSLSCSPSSYILSSQYVPGHLWFIRRKPMLSSLLCVKKLSKSLHMWGRISLIPRLLVGESLGTRQDVRKINPVTIQLCACPSHGNSVQRWQEFIVIWYWVNFTSFPVNSLHSYNQHSHLYL